MLGKLRPEKTDIGNKHIRHTIERTLCYKTKWGLIFLQRDLEHLNELLPEVMEHRVGG